jgi:hypothetical protein
LYDEEGISILKAHSVFECSALGMREKGRMEEQERKGNFKI